MGVITIVCFLIGVPAILFALFQTIQGKVSGIILITLGGIALQFAYAVNASSGTPNAARMAQEVMTVIAVLGAILSCIA